MARFKCSKLDELLAQWFVPPSCDNRQVRILLFSLAILSGSPKTSKK
jgi:hypothetical protein